MISPGDLMDTWCEFKISAKQNPNLGAGGGRGGKQQARPQERALAADQLPNKSLLAAANFQPWGEDDESFSGGKQGWGQDRTEHGKAALVLLLGPSQSSKKKGCWGESGFTMEREHFGAGRRWGTRQKFTCLQNSALSSHLQTGLLGRGRPFCL